jgi:hypothetical protein
MDIGDKGVATLVSSMCFMGVEGAVTKSFEASTEAATELVCRDGMSIAIGLTLYVECLGLRLGPGLDVGGVGSGNKRAEDAGCDSIILDMVERGSSIACFASSISKILNRTQRFLIGQSVLAKYSYNYPSFFAALPNNRLLVGEILRNFR